MKEWLDIKELLWIIIAIVLSSTSIIIYSIFHPKIKYLEKQERYCIIWEKLRHYEELGDKDRYELEIIWVRLPKFLNWFRK